MKNIVYPYVDEIGCLWLDSSGFIGEPDKCFKCGALTDRIDVCYMAHFCESEQCNRAIALELLKYADDWEYFLEK